MEDDKKEVKIFSFYGGDIATSQKVASEIRKTGRYHAVWNCWDSMPPNGNGWYVKYIEK